MDSQKNKKRPTTSPFFRISRNPKNRGRSKKADFACVLEVSEICAAAAAVRFGFRGPVFFRVGRGSINVGDSGGVGFGWGGVGGVFLKFSMRRGWAVGRAVVPLYPPFWPNPWGAGITNICLGGVGGVWVGGGGGGVWGLPPTPTQTKSRSVA